MQTKLVSITVRQALRILERNGYRLLRAFYDTDQCRHYVFKLEGGENVTLSMSSLRGLALQLNA
jgi:predicted RNA binding protein YcfA (HicA-like mRNA interferase family)